MCKVCARTSVRTEVMRQIEKPRLTVIMLRAFACAGYSPAIKKEQHAVTTPITQATTEVLGAADKEIRRAYTQGRTATVLFVHSIGAHVCHGAVGIPSSSTDCECHSSAGDSSKPQGMFSVAAVPPVWKAKARQKADSITGQAHQV